MFSKIFKRTMVGVLTLGLALVINGCGQVD
jgi:hypothetical protein